MPLTPLQFPFDSLTDEVGTLFAIVQNGVDPGQRPLRESGGHLFVVDLFASHGRRIDDITKCYKPYFSRYLLLTAMRYLISSKTSERETNMHTNTTARQFRQRIKPEEACMVSFPSTLKNNAARKGELAARKQFFGDNSRYAVAPVHTRFDALEWFVWDAEHPLSNLSRAEVIRQAETLEDALRGI